MIDHSKYSCFGSCLQLSFLLRLSALFALLFAFLPLLSWLNPIWFWSSSCKCPIIPFSPLCLCMLYVGFCLQGHTDLSYSFSPAQLIELFCCRWGNYLAWCRAPCSLGGRRWLLGKGPCLAHASSAAANQEHLQAMGSARSAWQGGAGWGPSSAHMPPFALVAIYLQCLALGITCGAEQIGNFGLAQRGWDKCLFFTS